MSDKEDSSHIKERVHYPAWSNALGVAEMVKDIRTEGDRKRRVAPKAQPPKTSIEDLHNAQVHLRTLGKWLEYSSTERSEAAAEVRTQNMAARYNNERYREVGELLNEWFAKKTAPFAAPPSGNKNWFRGSFGQWRLPAAHKWQFGRQGIHALLGAWVGGLLLAGIFTHWGLIAAATVITWLFCRYEVVEDARIRDFAYVDIGGYLVGFTLSVSIGAAALVYLALR